MIRANWLQRTTWNRALTISRDECINRRTSRWLRYGNQLSMIDYINLRHMQEYWPEFPHYLKPFRPYRIVRDLTIMPGATLFIRQFFFVSHVHLWNKNGYINVLITSTSLFRNWSRSAYLAECSNSRPGKSSGQRNIIWSHSIQGTRDGIDRFREYLLKKLI